MDNQLPSLTLGTVQLGHPYGIANRQGMPNDEAAFAVMDAAWKGGVRNFDTARLYGGAEKRIGAWIASRGHHPFIITKTLKVEDDATCEATIHKSTMQSLEALGVNHLDILMFHQPKDLFRPGAERALRRLQKKGLIGGFGISAYQPYDVDRALTEFDISAVQVPYNLFDRRFETNGTLERCKNAGVTVFARSPFLQGLVFLQPQDLPDHLGQAIAPLRSLNAYARDIRRPVAEIAFVAIRSTPGISSIVVGAEQASQIVDVIKFSQSPPLSRTERQTVFEICADLPETIYHPGKWNVANSQS